MTFRSNFRNLALATALSGCAAATQQQQWTAVPSIGMQRREETVQQRCARERTTRVQECIIEGIVTQCRTRDAAGVQPCVDEGLSQSTTFENLRSLTATVSAGQEVFSMRVGNSTMMQVMRLDATTIDSSGVAFSFDIDRFSPLGGDKNAVTHEELRVNFDGVRSGNWTRFGITEVRVVAVEAAGAGGARVTLETEDPRVTVRAPPPSK